MKSHRLINNQTSVVTITLNIFIQSIYIYVLLFKVFKYSNNILGDVSKIHPIICIDQMIILKLKLSKKHLFLQYAQFFNLFLQYVQYVEAPTTREAYTCRDVLKEAYSS